MKQHQPYVGHSGVLRRDFVLLRSKTNIKAVYLPLVDPVYCESGLETYCTLLVRLKLAKSAFSTDPHPDLQ